MRRLGVCLSLTVALLSAGAWGAPPVTRLLRTIDFEERARGNDESLPMHWVKVVGPDLPHYLSGTLTDDRARSGKYSFRLDLNGGGLVYRYDAGEIPVLPGAHYRVDGFAMTSPLAHARARISAAFADRRGRLIAGTIRYSDRYAGDEQTWKELSVDVTADSPEATSLIIGVELVQPANYAPVSDDKKGLQPQDITGNAWFDDIRVWQVPEISLHSDRPGNIFPRGQAVRLSASIDDRATEDLTGQFIVKDANGAVMYQRSARLHGTHMPLDGPDDLRPGWYKISAILSSAGVEVARRDTAIVIVGDEFKASARDGRIAVSEVGASSDAWNSLAGAFPLLHIGNVATEADQDASEFSRRVEQLLENGITVTAQLPPTTLDVVKSEEWKSTLGELVARHANHVTAWQLGPTPENELAAVASTVRKQLAQLLRNPNLLVTRTATESDGKLDASETIEIPATVPPEQIGVYIQELKSRANSGGQAHVKLEPLDRDRHGRDAQIRDLALRVLYSLSANATRVEVPLPFAIHGHGDLEPTELLLPIRALGGSLAGATFKGMVPVSVGVEAMLFERDGMGILALWSASEAGKAESRQLELDPGPRARIVDLLGNSSPLLVSSESRDSGKVRLSVGPMPVIVVDVDGPLALLRASVALDRPLIESTFQAHARRIRFTNPYKRAISGSVKLSSPSGWTLSPAAMSFSLNPGETFDREFSVQFPYSSISGAKTINASFNFVADRAISFVAPLTVKLGLSDVGMSAVAFREGRDIIVQQTVNNYSDKPVDYAAFAMYPQQARQERLVTNLGAGQSIIKRYRFKDARLEPGAKVRVGVKEQLGNRLLNDEVAVHVGATLVSPSPTARTD